MSRGFYKGCLIALVIGAVLWLLLFLLGRWIWMEIQREAVIQTAEQITRGEA
jgi:hypothetical protein